MRDPEIRTLWPIAVVCGALLASSYVVLVDCEIDYPAQSTEMPYNFDCAAFDYTFFNGTPKRVGPPATSGIVAYHQTIQAIRGDALQQTISRIFAIIMRQAFGVHNVTLMQTVDNSSELMDESERINQQLQLLVNKVQTTPPKGGQLLAFNAAVQHPVAYAMLEQSRNVQNVGPLGIRTRFGWFLPKRTPPDRLGRAQQVPIEAFGRDAFANISALFHVDIDRALHGIVSAAGGLERFVPEHCDGGAGPNACAVMLAGHRSSSAFIVEHIRALNVSVQVVWLGDQLVRVKHELMQQRAAGPLVLLLARTPSEAVINARDYRYVTVQSSNAGPLSEMQAAVYDLTPMTKYRNPQQVELGFYIDNVDLDKQDVPLASRLADELMSLSSNASRTAAAADAIYDRVACDWLSSADVPGKFLADMHNAVDQFHGLVTKKLYIGGIFPDGAAYNVVRNAVRQAIDDVNASGMLLPNRELALLEKDRAETPLRQFLRLAASDQMVGVIGPDVKEITYIAEPARVLSVSYSSDGGAALFDHPEEYPYSFRTIGDRRQFEPVYRALFDQFGWQRVALLTDSDSTRVQYMSELEASLKNARIDVAAVHIAKRACAPEIAARLRTISDRRIIILDASVPMADEILCAAHALRMTAAHNYAWFLPGHLADMERNGSGVIQTNATRCDGVHQTNATCDLAAAYDGHLTLYHAPFSPAANPTTLNKFLPVNTNASHSPPSYAGFAYDAVLVLATALAHRPPEAAFTQLNTSVAATNLTTPPTLSGPIVFAGRASRITDILVGQRFAGAWRILYKYTLDPSLAQNANTPAIDLFAAGQLSRQLLPPHAPIWSHLAGSDPLWDGTPHCHLHALATWLRCSCTAAMIGVYAGLAVAAVAALLAVMYVFWERRYTARLEREAQVLRSFGIDLLAKQVDETRLDRSEIPRHNIVLNRRLGGGQFGTVYFGQYRNERTPGGVGLCEQVAIKTPENANNFNMRLEFLSEAQAMRRFDHPNIVRLVGVSLLADPMYIVMEYMVLGDLSMYLLSRRTQVTRETQELWSRRLTGIVLDLARGLAYMAELRYVHRDIACRNCLLTGTEERITAKLADFGMTRPVYRDDVYRFRRRGALPVRWSAPESMRSGMYSPATDVWSFGVLMWEIVTLGAHPYHEVTDDHVLLALIRSGRTLTIPAQANEDLRWLMGECWHLEAGMRQRAAEIVDFVSSRPMVVEPCLAEAGGEEFAQIYEMNNEPDGLGRWRKGAQLLQQRLNGAGEVQTLRNDLSGVVSGVGVVGIANADNYLNGVQRPVFAATTTMHGGGGYQAYLHSLLGDSGVNNVERPLLAQSNGVPGKANVNVKRRKLRTGEASGWLRSAWDKVLVFWRGRQRFDERTADGGEREGL